MNKEIKLSSKSRDVKKENSNKTRAEGFIPAVIYGFGVDNQNIKVKKNEFEKVFNLAGESNLIDLMIEGKEEPIKVIIKDFQTSSVKGTLIHVDFYQVDMSKKITVEIPLDFIGESSAVKEFGGVLVRNMDSVEVECLPDSLVDHIDVDLTQLSSINDSIKLCDIKVPQGMEFTQNKDEVVVGVSEKQQEEVEAIVEEDENKDKEKSEEDKTNETGAGAEANKK